MSILWAQPRGWGLSAICHYSHLGKSLRKGCRTTRRAQEERMWEMRRGLGSTLGHILMGL